MNWLPFFLLFTAAITTAEQDVLESGLNVSSKTTELGKASQTKINQLSNETDDMLREYQRVLQKGDYQKAYNDELKSRVLAQEKELQSLQAQMGDVQITRLHMLPYLKEITANLKKFIALDLPFEQQERLESINALEKLLADSSVSISDKFRRVMEAWQTESDYSYDIAQYRGTATQGNEILSVEYLRIGRSSLFYQTLDGTKSAMWHRQKKQWIMLDSVFNREIRQSIQVASQQLPPQLLTLPFVVEEVNK